MKVLLTCAAILFSALACTPMASKESVSDERGISYRCANGETVRVQYSADQGLATLIRDGDAIALKARPTGSGFHYSNGPNTLRGKGEELTLEIGRRVPIRCRAENDG